MVDPGQALAAALALAEKVAVNAPVAVRQVRRVVLASESANDEELWRITDEAQAAAEASEDFREGVAGVRREAAAGVDRALTRTHPSRIGMGLHSQDCDEPLPMVISNEEPAGSTSDQSTRPVR